MATRRHPGNDAAANIAASRARSRHRRSGRTSRNSPSTTPIGSKFGRTTIAALEASPASSGERRLPPVAVAAENVPQSRGGHIAHRLHQLEQERGAAREKKRGRQPHAPRESSTERVCRPHEQHAKERHHDER
jgi:hypothetical protein